MICQHNAEPETCLQCEVERTASDREAKIVSGGILIDALECCDRLGVSYHTLLKAVKRGHVPAIRIQNGYRFHWPTIIAKGVPNDSKL